MNEHIKQNGINALHIVQLYFSDFVSKHKYFFPDNAANKFTIFITDYFKKSLFPLKYPLPLPSN